MSEAIVKTNRMVSRKWTYHKERSFASNYFIILKKCLKNGISESIVHVIKHANFQLYRVRPDGVI